MDDNLQDVRVPGNPGTADTAQQSASVSFGQVIPTSVPNPSAAQAFPVISHPMTPTPPAPVVPAPVAIPIAAPAIPTAAPIQALPIAGRVSTPAPAPTLQSSATQPGFTQTPVAPPAVKPVVPHGPKRNFNWKKIAKYGGITLVVLLILGGIAAVALNFISKRNEGQVLTASRFNTVQIPLEDLGTEGGVSLLGTRSLLVNGPLRANSAFIISPSAQPSNASRGQIYYDQNSNEMAYFNGSRFVPINDNTNVVQTLGGLTGTITLGQGLNGANGQISNNGVLTVQGQAGNVTFVGGPGITVDGTTITNSGVTSFGGQTGDITVGNGLSITPAGELQNSGVVSATGGAGITVIDDGSGNITISNTGAGSGTVQSPGGTAGRIAKFTGVQTIEDSLLSEAGTTVTVNGDLSVTGSLALGNALTIGNGGTGTTALAANGVVIGQGAGALTAVTAGGSGLCFMSTGGAPAFQACPGGAGVLSVNGLTGALTIANATGVGTTITLNDASTSQKGIAQFNSTNFTAASGIINTVQNIHVAATPTFGTLTLTSSQATNPMLLVNNTNGGATGNLVDIQLNGASRLALSPAGNMTVSGTINGQTISSAASFTGTLNVAGNTTTAGDLAVNGGDITSTGALNITPGGALTVGVAAQSLTLQGNGSTTLSATNAGNTTTVSFQSPTANVNYRLLTAAAGTYDICTTVGNCAGVGGGVTSPGGTVNQIPKFTGSNTIGDSIISDNGTTVSIAGALAVNTITPSGAMTIGATAQNLTLQGASTSLSATSGGITSTLNFATPSGGNKTITIPNASGTVAVSASGPLALDAAGNLTCTTCLTAGSVVSSLNGLTGALTIANASGLGTTITIQDASTSQKGIAQFNSTNFSAASGVINTIQDIHVAATPTFGTLTLTSSQATSPMLLVNNTNVSGTGNLIDLQLNGASRLAVSPAGNMTLTGTINGQTISSAASFTGTLAVTGAANLNGGATVTGTLTANTITPTGAMTVGATGQSLSLQGNASSTFSATNGANSTTLSFQSPTANVTYRLLTTAAGTYDICTTAGNCVGTGGGVTTAGGTTNQLAKFSGSTTIADSIISDNGTTVTIGGILAVNTITPTGALTIGATGQNLLLQGATTSLTSTNGGITNTLTFATPSGSNKTITVPNATGTVAVSASGPITLDAAGNIACPTCALTGSGVTSLNGLTGALTIANATGSGSTVTIQDASTSQKGIAQFSSTNFSAASGVINTIQDIDVTAAPTFGRLTVTSSQATNAMLLVNNTNAGATGNLLDVQLNGASRLSVSPAGNMTLTGTVNGQTISSAANLTGTLAVAGAANLNGGAIVTGTLTANTITPTGALTVGATTQSFLVQGSAASTITATSGASTTTVSFQTPTANVTYRLLTAAAGTYDICTTVGNCAGVGGGVTTPGGTAGAIAKFSGAGTIVDSIITESGSTITIGGTLAVNTITPAAAMTIGSTSQDVTLQGADTTISETGGGFTNSLVFATPSGSNKTITLPNASGTVAVSASGPLAIDAAGNISCSTCLTSGGGPGGAVDSLNGLTGTLTLANATGLGTTITIDDASTSQKGIAQFNATNFSASAGVINTIQNINTTAAPTFGQLTLSSSQASAAMLTVNNTNVAATGNLIDIQLNGTSRLSVTPAGNMTVTGTVNGQTISSAASLTGTLAVAGAANLNGGASVTGTLTANTISPTGAMTIGATNQSFALQGSGTSTVSATNAGSTTTLAFQTPTANVTYRLLTAAAGTYDICTTVGNCAGVGGGVTSPGGTTGRIAKFTGSNTIGDSLLSEAGSIVTVTGTLAASTALQTPLLDTATATALNIGTTNATAINLNQDTTVAGNLDVTTGFLTVGTFQVAQSGDTLTGGDVDIQGGGLNIGTTSQAGTITVSDGSSNTVVLQTAALGTSRTVTFGDETGTVCLQNSVNCGFAASSGSANYIQNQNSVDQTANLRISGTGRANTSLLTPLLDTAAAGTLTLGGTATAIALNENTTITGNLAQSTGTISLAANNTSSITTSAGALTITAASTSVWSTSGGNLTIQAATTNNLNLQTGGAGTVALGDQNTTTINIGRGSNIIRTINIGDTGGGSQAQTVNVGNTGSSSVTTIKGGGGVTINAASGAWSLQGASTSTMAGTSGSFTTTLGFTTPTANTTINLPALTAGTYTVCTSSGNCAGAGVTLQSTYNNSTNPELTLDATRGALTIRDASSALGANLLEVQNNAGSTTYFAVSATGTSTTGTATATGDINSSGGALQTNSTTRVDNSGNLVNIGNITGTGAITIASSGAGNDIIINGADAFIVQDASQFTSTLQVDAAATFNSDVTLALADTENLDISNTVTGTNDLTLVNINLTNNTASGNQYGQLIRNTAGSGVTDSLLILENADVDTAVSNGLLIASAAGSITNAIDVSDADIVNAILFGANAIIGTNLTIDGSNGNLTTAGDIAVNGGDITSTGALNITPGGALGIGATSQAFTLQGNASSTITATAGGFTTTVGFVGTAVGAVTYQFDRSAAAGTYSICTTTGNCAGVGGGVTTPGGTAGTIAKFTASGTIADSIITESGAAISVAGTAIATTALQSPLLDTAVAGALAIGTTNATSINLNQNTTLAAGKSLTVTGGNTASRPGSPTEGMVYFDTDTDSLLVYSNGKWQADRSTANKIVGMGSPGGCSGSVPTASANPDGADFVVNSCTDADATINSAIAALPASGGTVYLMDGVYIVDGAINVPNNVTLTGSGASTTVKVRNTLGSSLNIVQNSDSTGGNSRITISNFRIDGNVANNGTSTIMGIALNKVGAGIGTTTVPGALVSNMQVENVYDAGVYLNGGSVHNVVRDTKITGSTAPRYGIYESLTGSQGYNTFTSNNIVASIYVMQLAGSLGSMVSNNVMSGCSVSNGCFYINGSNNVITGNELNISGIFDGFHGNGSYNTLSDNVITGTGGASGSGIHVNFAGGNWTITGNTIRSTTGHGIFLEGTSGNIVDGNRIQDIGSSSNRSSITVRTYSGSIVSSKNQITNNIISDSAGTGYAIEIQSGQVNTYLSNNTFGGTGAASISDSGSGTVYANQLAGTGRDLAVQAPGGMAIGKTSATASVSVQGAYVSNALPTPSAPTIATQGAAGSTSYTYAVTAYDGLGETVASTTTTIATGNATLNGSNFNRLTITPVGGALNYRVYRTASGGTPSSTGLIGTATNLGTSTSLVTFDDTGLAGSGSSPGTNTTGGMSLAGGLQGTTATFGSASALTLGTSSSATGSINFKGSGGANSITVIGQANPTSNQTITLPDETGTVCLQSSANCGFAVGAGTAILQNGNTLGGAVTIGTNDAFGLNLEVNNTTVLSLSSTGAATFQNSANSNAAFRILNAAGTTTVFLADTSANRIGVNTTTPNNALTINGNFNVRDADTATKQYRFRTSGSALDFEGAGANMYISVFQNADFTGTQHNKLIFENNDITQAIKTWQFRDSVNGGIRHLIDANTGGQVVFNENSESTDFRVEGDVDANALFVQGSTSRIGIGTNSPSAKLHVSSSVAEPLFRVTDGTTTAADVMNIADEGAATFKNRTDGNMAFEIQGAAATPLFRVDTSARKIGVGAYSQTLADNLIGQLTVFPVHDTRTGVVVKGFSPTWNANFFEAQDSAGNPMFRVQSTGIVITAGGVFSSNGQTAASTNSNFATLTSGNVSGATSNSGNANIKSGDSTTSGNTGSVTVLSGNATSGNSGNVVVDVGTASATTGTVFVGTTSASAVAVGNGTNTAISLNSGTGTISVGTGAQARTINIGTGAAAQTLTIGSTTTTSATTIQAGTGHLTLSTNNSAASIIAKSSTNSADAFRILNSSNTDLFKVDTVNNHIYIGSPTADATGALLVLDTKNTSGDPSGINGSMYYNSALHQFRCYRGVNATAGDGNWEACGMNPIDRGWVVTDEFLGGSWDSGVVGELGWTNDFQTGTPALDYGQGMGFASADRPGIIEINTSATLNAGVTLTLDRDGVGSVTMAAGNTVKTTAGLDSTLTNAIFRTGLHNEGGSNARPTAGVWWEAAPTVNSRWQFCYGSGGTATCSNATNTTPTINSTQWYRLEIRIVATGSGTSQIDYFIDGQKFSVTGVTLTTTTLVRPAMACWNSVAAQRFCNIDFYQFSGTAGAAR